MGFMSMVMSKIGIHADFIKMVEIMYKDATLKIKVNSHVGEGFHPTNGVAQGSPLSPILYLLVIQSFISLINTSPDVEGISVPGIGGMRVTAAPSRQGRSQTTSISICATPTNSSLSAHCWPYIKTRQAPSTHGLKPSDCVSGRSGGPTSSQTDG